MRKKQVFGICDRCGGIREFRKWRKGFECQNCKAWFPSIMQVDAEVTGKGESPKYY